MLNALGVVYDKLGRFDLSARYYAQALEVDPNSRIAAGNFDYSRKLQGVFDPANRTAVASNNLPDASGDLPQMTAKIQEAEGVNVDAQLRQAIVETAPPVAVANLSPEPDQQNPKPNTDSAGSDRSSLKLSASLAPSRGATPIAPFSTQSLKPSKLEHLIKTGIRKDAEVRKGIFVIGQPVRVLNATGTKDRVELVTRGLAKLGWSVRQGEAIRSQVQTSLLYPTRNSVVAKAMQRTLPFPVRLVPVSNGARMQLLVGQDYLSWKPQNPRVATLWQKNAVIASLQNRP